MSNYNGNYCSKYEELKEFVSPCLLYSTSLSVFIVSDSEDVGAISSDDEENLRPIIHFGSPAGPPKPPKTASPYQTPCTPASGIMFWGSPTRENIIKAQTTVSKKHRRPLGISNFYDSPTCEPLLYSTNYANILSSCWKGIGSLMYACILSENIVTESASVPYKFICTMVVTF